MSDQRLPQDAAGAYAAEISGRCVVLDVQADRYFLAPLSARARFASDRAANDWRASGACWPKGAVRLDAALEALVCLRKVSALLRRGPFEALVSEVGEEPLRRSRRSAAPEQLLASFEGCRPLFPIAPICRLDAPALTLFLRRHGHRARLVFGARLEPFAAHCWTELDGAVVNEPVERVAAFTPILMV
jgi:hypothetical protein